MEALFSAKLAAARAVGSLSRRSGRGGGTTLPGRVLVRLAPDAIERLARRLPGGVALVSATNGKTTTAAMAATILAPDVPLCRNGSGANLVSGVASALLAAPPAARLGLFEVDEAALAEVARRTRPRTLLLGNLFRDQLDRYGELELVGARWREVIARLDGCQVVACADDPLVNAIADGTPGLRYGLDDPRHALPAVQHAADSTACVRCGAPYAYAAPYLGHLGDFACPRCGHARGALDFAARDVELHGLAGSRFRLDTPDGPVSVAVSLPGIYNVYNATAAIALASLHGVPPLTAAVRLGGFRAAFGRFERLRFGDRELVLVLVKNPAGANEALRTLGDDLDGATVLAVLNDRIADGRDVSWIWDVDFEDALPRVGRLYCSGSRAADLALRAKYAGVAADRLVRVDDLGAALDQALAEAGPGGVVYVLPTYTAMLELQRLATARGLTRPYWEVTR
jgi:UDP-N-acetylmuramyl tripeptide synthase